MWPFEVFKKLKKIAILAGPSYASKPETSEEIEVERMVKRLREVFLNTNHKIIILCIGSDRSTGDSLGPMVGTMLKENNVSFPVYGTLEEPVHALNLKKVLKRIKQKYPNSFILGIDACLGDENHIGTVLLKEGSFVPGNAINKSLPSIGDYHIKAIVNQLHPFAPIQSLNSTRLYTVNKLAKIIVKIIVKASVDEEGQ